MHVVVTGPESCGKTTLARLLAQQLQRPLVAEQARDYLARTPAVPQQGYLPSDLLAIAGAQQQAETHHSPSALVADTDLQVLSIWWQEKFGPTPVVLSSAYAAQSSRFYVLCQPDLAWEPDPLRENPDDRARLFALYEADLRARNLAYCVAHGSGHGRLNSVLDQVLNAVRG